MRTRNADRERGRCDANVRPCARTVRESLTTNWMGTAVRACVARRPVVVGRRRRARRCGVRNEQQFIRFPGGRHLAMGSAVSGKAGENVRDADVLSNGLFSARTLALSFSSVRLGFASSVSAGLVSVSRLLRDFYKLVPHTHLETGYFPASIAFRRNIKKQTRGNNEIACIFDSIPALFRTTRQSVVFRCPSFLYTIKKTRF